MMPMLHRIRLSPSRTISFKRARHALVTRRPHAPDALPALVPPVPGAAAPARPEQRRGNAEPGRDPREGEELAAETGVDAVFMQLILEDARDGEEQADGGGGRRDGEERGDVRGEGGHEGGDAGEEEGQEAEEQGDGGGHGGDDVGREEPLAYLLVGVEGVVPLVGDERGDGRALEVPDLQGVEVVAGLLGGAEVRGGGRGGALAVVPEADIVVGAEAGGFGDVDGDVVDVGGDLGGVEAEEVEGG